MIGTIPLGGAPEFAVSDGKGTVYINLEDKNEVVAVGGPRSYHQVTLAGGSRRKTDCPCH